MSPLTGDRRLESTSLQRPDSPRTIWNEAEWRFGVARLSLRAALESVDTGNLVNNQVAVSDRSAMARGMSGSFRQKPRRLGGEAGHIPRLWVRFKRAHGQVYTSENPQVETLSRLEWKAGEMADTLAPGGILMRICPMWLHGCVSLCKTAVYSWLDHRAPTMGAAIAITRYSRLRRCWSW